MMGAPMMAAMMLPGAAPAVAHRARDRRGALRAPLFAAAYAGIWLLIGLAAYRVYQPPGPVVAGALVLAGGLYELTPFKRECRRRCREQRRSGVLFGAYCVGSSLGLMLILAAIDLMSVAWMCAIAAVVLIQKLLPPRAAIDVPLALALVAVAGVVAVV